jgi:hypothetical protein
MESSVRPTGDDTNRGAPHQGWLQQPLELPFKHCSSKIGLRGAAVHQGPPTQLILPIWFPHIINWRHSNGHMLSSPCYGSNIDIICVHLQLAAISSFRASPLNLSMNPYTKHRLCRHSGILLGLSLNITHDDNNCNPWKRGLFLQFQSQALSHITSWKCQIIMIFNRSGLHVPITHDPALYHLFQEEQEPRIGYMLFTTCGPAPNFSLNYWGCGEIDYHSSTT